MKQRVGIARRALDRAEDDADGRAVLALDALTRGTLQDEVRRICLTTGQTTFMISHDVDEGIYLADRIVLMTNGPARSLPRSWKSAAEGARAHRSAPPPALLPAAQPHHRLPRDAQPHFVGVTPGLRPAQGRGHPPARRAGRGRRAIANAS
jgi:energy-coupling factor transporter ATP-binding protein EcfA2